MSSRVHLLPFTALVLTLGAVGGASAQRLEDGKIEFERKARASRTLRNQLFKGEVAADPKDRNHLEAIEVAAREVTYYLYWDSIDRRPKAGAMQSVIDDFEGRLNQLIRFKANTAALNPLFIKNVIECALEVAQKGRPIAAINAARILARIPERREDRGTRQSEKDWKDEVLPRLSEGNAEALAGAYLTLLADPKTTDGTRYYVYRGLSELLAFPTQDPPLLKQETRDRAILAALPVVEKKVVFPKATPTPEVDGYRVLRREAIRVVAQAGAPMIQDKARPALALARIAAGGDRISPAPRLDERIEATLGLCRLVPTASKVADFQPEPAISVIALFIKDFATAANANLDSKVTERLRPWRVDASRLLEGIDQLKADKSPLAADVVKLAGPVLTAIESGKQGSPESLTIWLDRNPPTGKPLFKSAPDSDIKLPGGEEK